MKTIFDKDNNGTAELVEALGMIDAGTDFSKWKPYIPLSVRRLTTIVGPEVYDKTLEFYHSAKAESETEEKYKTLLLMMQQSVALFTWLKIIPTLDAQHGNTGRQKRLGENEKGLTAIQEYKDEINILNLAYESVDALIAFLDKEEFDFWMNSEKKKAINQLLIRSKEEFDIYYTIGSHRLFLTLAPIIREMQDRYIIPIITRKRYEQSLSGDEPGEGFIDAVCRPLALLTMQKAIERLPVEVLPDGVVQVQQVGTVKEKIKAEAEARKAVSKSLGDDAGKDLVALQDFIAAIEAEPDEPDLYLPKATIQSKGITF
jgi:hypothetical protein